MTVLCVYVCVSCAMVQSLQTEVHRASAVNQQLQQKVTLLSETKKGRSEADWKRTESEKQVKRFTNACSFYF